MKSFIHPCPKHVLVSTENGVTKIEVNRGESDLGFSFVGGFDTPLVSEEGPSKMVFRGRSQMINV